MIDSRAVLIGTRVVALVLALSAAAAEAATKPSSPPPQASSPIQILPGTSSKEPISIDADKLVYFDKEQKAIYSGNVVVIQGDTKMTCSVMNVFLDRAPAPATTAQTADAKGATAPADGQQGPSQNSGIKRLEAAGPVTVVSKTQVATGDSGVYDKTQDKVFLIGHVTLSDGQNVTKGDKLTYDLKSGQATIDTNGGKSGRVHGLFTPNNAAEPAKPK
ncbi:lipopolysaccharide export system protein LptA [Roseiarcus fermentans]|uniref:Lipopolysaccharide export system protein LptA n=1 Tax=Roseiarcus fermentans TaxID=1473586 RepID=A0A366FX03_9HYPH|nr:LptA/OstA family protein [Roseiarcus fermentans]RBP18265.1 lipopolysaccharide export system protein LptA [Roseiarcus fermentans]